MEKIKSEIRKSYLLDKYVIITPGRALRPRDLQEKSITKKTDFCPFCPENIDSANIIDKTSFTSPSKSSWDLLSIKNIFPAVQLDNNKAYGSQEVIIETPRHGEEMASLSEGEIEQILHLYARRTTVLSKNKKINYILCFKNQGAKAGASISHSHSQIFAAQITPPDLKAEIEAAKGYELKNKSCPYCDIIKKEAVSARKIFSDKNIACFTPYASEYHYEAWIFPKRHVDNITLLTAEEFKSLAKALKKILLKLQGLDLAFNFFLHNLVSEKNQHLYLKIQPRGSVWAGVELGSGLIINSVSPEKAAVFYRS